MSSASSASDASSAFVRRMKPPVLPSGTPSAASACTRVRRLSRRLAGIFCDTPMWSSCGKKTSMRPARLICVDRRAPLVPMGSLMTWTISVWPSNTCFSIGLGGVAARLALRLSPSSGRCHRSATCKNAARSNPISMNADCMPGSTRATLPRYTLPTRPRSSVRSTCTSCTAPYSTTATRVSWGDQLIRMSCCIFCSCLRSMDGR